MVFALQAEIFLFLGGGWKKEVAPPPFRLKQPRTECGRKAAALEEKAVAIERWWWW